jgi:hypothetical protein
MQMTDRKKPGWTFWVAVGLIVAPVLYVASFGPFCWYASAEMCNHGPEPTAMIALVFVPLGKIAVDGPEFLSLPLSKYASCRVSEDCIPWVPIGRTKWHGVRR